MAERRYPRTGSPRRGRYQGWEVVQGIPEMNALDEARRRENAREDAHRIKTAGGFDADMFFGVPSYATGGAAGRHGHVSHEDSPGRHAAEPAPDEQGEPNGG